MKHFGTSYIFLIFLTACGVHGSDPIRKDGNDSPNSAFENSKISDFTNQSGSRLKFIVANGDDGSEINLGIYDLSMKTECAVRKDKTGTYRCLPLNSYELKSRFNNYFYDEKCQFPQLITTRLQPEYLNKFGNVNSYWVYEVFNSIEKIIQVNLKFVNKEQKLYEKNFSEKCIESDSTTYYVPTNLEIISFDKFVEMKEVSLK